MYNILLLNKIAQCGTDLFDRSKYAVGDSIENPDAILVRSASMDEIFASCDYITLHIPATPETKGTLCAANIAKMKDGVRLLNFSRADLAVAADIKAGLESGKIAKYVTDFPTEEILGAKNLIAIPHLGASTEESEDNCAVMAVNELRDFLEMGNITHSVNYPDVSLPHSGDLRICLCHKNIPAMLTQITAVLAQENINIENMVNRSKKEYAYTIVEIIGEIPQDTAERLRAIDGIIRVNILR